jgi:hypothetical protein
MKAATHQQMGTSQPAMNLQAGGREGSGAQEEGGRDSAETPRRTEARRACTPCH